MMRNLNHLTALSAFLVGAATVSIATPAQSFTAPPPVTFGYDCITGNNSTNCAIGESQFSTQVSLYSPTQVLFKFFNVGSLASSITQIYFEDADPNSLLKLAGIMNSAGVSFVENTKKNLNLPGGRTINFAAEFGANATSPVQPSGVNPGETVGILFDIVNGYNDPFNAVITDLQNGGLRIGFHAQGFSNGGSESFVNEEVPEPFTILGSAAAIAGGVALKRRTANKTSMNKEKSLVS